MKLNTSQPGVTLVELLVAIGIVAILAVGMFTVGSYVETQTKEKLAKSTIETLVTALEQYYDFHNKFPDPNNSDYDSHCEALFGQLYSTPEAKKVLMQINETSIADKDDNNEPEIYDPWGTLLKYTYETGDNFPVITSAGSDADFNSIADNITSR